MGKKYLKINPTTDSKKGIKIKKNEKQKASTSENSKESVNENGTKANDMELRYVEEPEIPELPSSDSKS